MSYKNNFKKCLDGLFESLCDVSGWMYENPELGFQEFKTSKYLVDYCLLYTSPSPRDVP